MLCKVQFLIFTGKRFRFPVAACCILNLLYVLKYRLNDERSIKKSTKICSHSILFCFVNFVQPVILESAQSNPLASHKAYLSLYFLSVTKLRIILNYIHPFKSHDFFEFQSCQGCTFYETSLRCHYDFPVLRLQIPYQQTLCFLSASCYSFAITWWREACWVSQRTISMFEQLWDVVLLSIS